MKNFSYNFLLGKDFLLKNKANFDFSSCWLKLFNVEIDFVAPKERKLVATVADLNIAARSTVAIQTQLSTDSMISSDMLIEGGFAKDNSYFVARILTKVRPKTKRTTVQISNLMDKNLTLPKNTPIADTILFAEDGNMKIDSKDFPQGEEGFLSENDLKIDHLDLGQRERLLKLLKEMKISQTPELGTVEIIEHNIDVGEAKPIKQQPYRVPIAKREIIDQEVEKMLVKEIIRPSVSPWSSLIVPVTKSDGSAWFCIDYRKVNSVTKKDAYPLPRIDDTLNALGGAKFFTTLDLQSGYWQVALGEKSKELTAFTTSKSHWEFNVLPFGLTNAPATFQRLMGLVLTGLH